MTEIAKAVVQEARHRGPVHSYFTGCSTGGQQALSEAQRYPGDYDGIVAGDPGNNRVHLIYKEHCEQCHKADATGDGHKKPSLRTDRIKSATDGDLEWFIRQGDLGKGMPSWSSLPQAQRWQLVAYLRSIQQ